MLNPTKRGGRGARGRAAVAAVAAVAVGAIAAVATGAVGGDDGPAVVGPRAVADDRAAGMLPQDAELLVASTGYRNDRLNDRLFRVPLDGDSTPELVTGVRCDRAHTNGDGTAVCMSRVRELGLDYDAVLLDGDYQPMRRTRLPGIDPDRARVSADGRLIGYTTFLVGHTYADNGVREFQTRAGIVDARSGARLLSLDRLDVVRDGRPFHPANANFWGVTFAGDDTFFATLGGGGRHYLLRGSIGSRTAEVVREGVECPSLSPDGSRIAYKRRIGAKDAWRLHVLDLRSGKDVALAEKRSIDDQPEWLGDHTIVYSDDEAVFAVPADGSGRAARIVSNAHSPAALS